VLTEGLVESARITGARKNKIYLTGIVEAIVYINTHIVKFAV
jgi:hypothetical protein